MSLGIMHDLAVGVHPDGADAWALQEVLALGVAAGAPPDEFNQLGQDWSQPPWRPDRSRAGVPTFPRTDPAVLRHAGGVRIDHIIGLFRLWWIPNGAAPTEGTYVRYDHEAMIGIVALEAHRAGAVVVGEDLGTVEPWVRDYLLLRGLLGTSILWFELDRDGTAARCRPSGGGSTACRRSPPTICRRPPVISRVTTSGVPAAVASTVLFSAVSSADPSGSTNALNVVGEPYAKAVAILKSQGAKAQFGGSFGSDVPQSQCIVSQQRTTSAGRMYLSLDCTTKAVQNATDSTPSGPAAAGAAPGAAPGAPAPGAGQGTYGGPIGVPVNVGG
jgi:hypothetical protein